MPRSILAHFPRRVLGTLPLAAAAVLVMSLPAAAWTTTYRISGLDNNSLMARPPR